MYLSVVFLIALLDLIPHKYFSDIYSNHPSMIAMYPRDERRLMTRADFDQYSGGGVLMCYTDVGTLERAAAAWLIGSHQLVLLNAHNFVNSDLIPTHSVKDCFFRIKYKDFYFDDDSLQIGAAVESSKLHITDDWALLRLLQPTPDDIKPQLVPDFSKLSISDGMSVTMVSPAGHSNTLLSETLEHCHIYQIDPPSEGATRRVRHDCNDGYGGSGSGLFSHDGYLIAIHSASLDMNTLRAFDINSHYGSALLLEGNLLEAIKKEIFLIK